VATDIPGFPTNKLDYKVTLFNGAALLPHIVTPTTNLLNGMVWTTSAGLFARINGATVGPYIASATLTGWTASNNTAAPNNVVPAARFVPSSASTDVDAVIGPKGAGAIQGQLADSSTVGGDKRGANAVDWQTFTRAAPGQVASGAYSVIGGGFRNMSSGAGSCIPGGGDCIASMDYSFAFGTGAISNSSGGIAWGRSANTRGINGMWAWGGTYNTGGNQFSALTPVQATAGTTPEVMTVDLGVAAINNMLNLADESACAFWGYVIARTSGGTGVGACKVWKFEGGAKHIAGTYSLIGTPTVTSSYADAGAASYTITLAADNTNKALAITATGGTGAFVNWTAYVAQIEAI
jgi:hypothetical protein